MKVIINYILVVMLGLILGACTQSYNPKPIAYFRFDLPDKAYQVFDSLSFPYQFEYPKYATITHKAKGPDQQYWINIEVPAYQASIYLSYKPLNNNLEQITEDVHNLLYKHTIKADGIAEQQFSGHTGKVYGFLYDLEGNAASAVQFYLTDSTKHFIRGSLYFNSVPNRDSLAPLINYFREDVVHLMESMQFKNPS